MDIAVLVVSVVAALAAVGSAVVAFVQRRDAQRAAGEAARSVEAAEQSATAAGRSATAAESSASSAEKAASAQESLAELARTKATAPPWRLAYRTGDTFSAWNDGDLPVFDVEVGGPGTLRSPAQAERVDARSAITFWGNPGWIDDHTVIVQWSSEPGGVTQTWSQPLPPKG
ncbi:hypothetical protein [Gordonia sp. NPDC003585]|uniref:hypothetical protein n=1 Tax=Gordonia sp. NPDC003585 TaxID=3154275 RepID=UPI0033A2B26A